MSIFILLILLFFFYFSTYRSFLLAGVFDEEDFEAYFNGSTDGTDYSLGVIGSPLACNGELQGEKPL